MCLGVPAEILSLQGKTALARVGGVKTRVDIQMTTEARVGDYVMVHAGFSIKVMDKPAALAAEGAMETIDSISRKAAVLIDRVQELAQGLGELSLMEVCGTHTVAIARSGLREKMPPNIRLVSGPGCPVCVTPAGEIDLAVKLAMDFGVRVISFGDMLRVPGARYDLDFARANGGRVDIVYSPRQALELAEKSAEECVFVAVGFETTAPLAAAVVKAAAAQGISNFSMLSSHRLIPPALAALLSEPDIGIDAFLCPGHVSTVIGSAAYEDLCRDYRKPFVVAGFEPLDVLEAIVMILEQLKKADPRVGNQYGRSVSREGSSGAKEIMADVFMVETGSWRGLGPIPDSALTLKPEFAAYDARKKFELREETVAEPPGCICGRILTGRAEPGKCGLFGKRCLPEKPIGPCMVSSEGACRADYLYTRARAGLM